MHFFIIIALDNAIKFNRLNTGIKGDGQRYEIKLALWLVIRAIKQRVPFQLACNVNGVGNFDDVLFKYAKNNEWNAILIQVKHKQNTNLNDAFLYDKALMYKCYASYMEIKNGYSNEKIVSDIKFANISYAIFTNGELPEICALKPANKEAVDLFLNINLYKNNDEAKSQLFSHSYFERCICETFKYGINEIMNTKLKFLGTYSTLPRNILKKQLIDLINEKKVLLFDEEPFSLLFHNFEEFLANLLIFHNQPNEKTLEMILIDELKDVTDYEPLEVYEKLIILLIKWHELSDIVITETNIIDVLKIYDESSTIRDYFNRLGEVKNYHINRIIYDTQSNHVMNVKNLEEIADKTPLIITGEAGLGKTTFINYLSQLYDRNYWIIKIKLSKFKEILSGDDESFLECIHAYKNPDKQRRFKEVLNEGNQILLLVDGFDEICPKFEIKVTLKLGNLIFQNCKMVVSTRYSYATRLAHNLDANLYKLKELNQDECMYYAKKYIETKFGNYNIVNNQFAKKIIDYTLENINSPTHNLFIGIPLQLQLVIEYFSRQLMNNDKISTNYDIKLFSNLYDLFYAFFDEKMKIYLKRIGISDYTPNYIIEYNKKQIVNSHITYAIEFLNFNKLYKHKHDQNLSKDDLLLIGFIDYFDTQENPIFVHKTFAEYFFALYLLKNQELFNHEIINFIKYNDFLGQILELMIIYESAEKFNILADDVETFKLMDWKTNRFGHTCLHIAIVTRCHKIVDFLIDAKIDLNSADNARNLRALHYAIQYNYPIDAIKKLVNYSNNNVIDCDKNTPLHYAIIYNKPDIAALILKQADTKLANMFHETPLQMAIRLKYIEIVKLLLNNDNVDVNYSNGFLYPPFMFSCSYGSLEIVKLLINHSKCDINYKQNKKYTALHAAAENGRMDIVKLLIEHETYEVEFTDFYFVVDRKCLDVVHLLMNSKKTNFTSAYYDFMLFVAAQAGYEDLVKLLISKAECSINKLNKFNDTALHIALNNKNPNVAALLINHDKCDINCLNQQSQTPLHLAAKLGFKKIVKFLLLNEKCAVNCIDQNHYTPLHLAVLASNLDIVLLLIANEKCDINVPCKTNDTSIHLAALQSNVDILNALINHKDCLINCLNSNQESVLHMAVRCNNVDAVSCLINHQNCNINCVNMANETPLHFACKYGFMDIVILLISNKLCNINCVNCKKNSPLHLAAVRGYLEVVKLLTDNKYCLIDLLNDDRKTPLHVAVDVGNLDIIRFLFNEEYVRKLR